MGKLFGTDGVRGVANTELTPELVMRLGRAGAYVLTKERKSQSPKILVGMDTRRSGDMLEAALTAGLCSVGAHVYRAGVIPTPGIAFLVRHYGYDAGVMISASHNPMQDNGIKFFNGDGFKLPDALEDEIEALVLAANDTLPRHSGADVGVAEDCDSAAEDYIAFLLATVPGLRLDGLTVALDCANGATSRIAPVVFHQLGATVYALHHEPDGVNINADCGSTHLSSLRGYVSENRIDLGLAFDGDGDRVLCVDENGDTVEGDEMMAVCGLDLKRRGALRNNAIVATVMSNMGLGLMCEKHDITLWQTAVGDRYVLEKMLEGDYVLGGEQSGHIIFREHNTTGDGMITGLQILSVMQSTGQKLSQLKKVMEVLPQVLVNVRVDNRRKYDWDKNTAITGAIDAIEACLAGAGRVLVRPSGTEPLVRVMIEGRDAVSINALAHDIADLITRELA